MRAVLFLAVPLLFGLHWLGFEGGLPLTSAGDKAEPAVAWQPLFTKEELKDWDGLMNHWTFKQGELVGTNLPGGLPFRTFLCSKKRYKDFELKFQVRVKGPRGRGNSGLNFRSEILDRQKFTVSGPQADMGQQFWGALSSEFIPGKPSTAVVSAPREVLDKVKVDDFNDYSVKCVGKHVTIQLNGETTVDGDFPWMQNDGIIAWQVHANPTEVTFRNLQLRDFSAPAGRLPSFLPKVEEKKKGK